MDQQAMPERMIGSPGREGRVLGWAALGVLSLVFSPTMVFLALHWLSRR